MATDGQCWHCGKSLPQSKLKNLKLPQISTAVPDDAPLPMPPLRIILLYVGLTAVALLLLISTTRAIGKAPLFLFSGNSIALPGWQPITDSQLQFTVNLPNTWQTVEFARAPEADVADLASGLPLQALGNTFDALVADTELLLLSVENDTAGSRVRSPAFVIVAQSQRLQQLSAAEIISYAEQQLPKSISIEEVGVSESLTEEPIGNLVFDVEHGGESWRCQEQFIPSQRGTFLVVACTGLAEYSAHIAEFATILRSFQPLRS